MEEKIVFGIAKPFPEYFDLNECALICLERSESDYNQLMQSIGINEVQTVAETGSIVIYEEGKIKSIVEQIIAWFKARMEDAKRLFQTCMDKINAKITEFKKKIDDKIVSVGEKQNASFKALADRIKPDAKLGTAYRYDGLENELESQKYLKAIKSYFNEIDKIQLGDTSAEVVSSKLEKAKSILTKAYGENIKIGATLSKEFKGEKYTVTKDDVVKHIEEYRKNALEFNQAKGKLKKSYNTTLGLFKSEMAVVKKNIKEDKSLSTLKPVISAYKQGIAYCMQYNGALTMAIYGKVLNDMGITLRCVISGKEKKEKPVGESTVFGGSIQTEISSLFSF